MFHADFNGHTAVEGWSLEDRDIVAGRGGTPSLRVVNKDPDASVMRHVDLDADRLAGQLVTITAAVKAEGVGEPPKSWNGIKVMLVLEKEGGGHEYTQIGLPHGTFDWRMASRTLRIPEGVRKATLALGLEKVAGTVWFDDIEVRLGRAISGGKRSATLFKGHDLSRLRGVMHGPAFNEENLRYLAEEWGANQVRWQLNWTPMKKAEEWAQDLDRFDEWLDWALAEADKAVDACEKYGINMLLDLHTPPGGRVEGGVCRMFSDIRYQDKLVEVWDRIAHRYKGRSTIYAYDLLNEPVEGMVSDGSQTWRDLAQRITEAIRTVDAGKPVVFEPSPWGGPAGFDQIVPLDVANVIYSFHMYIPHRFTHQGVHGTPTGTRYPGPLGGVDWDKEELRRAMLPAIEFQRDFNVHVYVGEFSAIRWAPDNSAYRYLRDVIDLFEEYGWDWSYHAYREWEGWSVEHGSDQEDP